VLTACPLRASKVLAELPTSLVSKLLAELPASVLSTVLAERLRRYSTPAWVAAVAFAHG